jgi:hypothetical protein
MDVMILKRIAETEDGTFGVLITDGAPFALTLERQWLNNERGKSCIPRGQYACERAMSPTFGETFEVVDVPGRSHILFHKGNLDDDSHGCILVGEMFGVLHGDNGILASAQGYDEFMGKLEGIDSFLLVVTNSI